MVDVYALVYKNTFYNVVFSESTATAPAVPVAIQLLAEVIFLDKDNNVLLGPPGGALEAASGLVAIQISINVERFPRSELMWTKGVQAWVDEPSNWTYGDYQAAVSPAWKVRGVSIL